MARLIDTDILIDYLRDSPDAVSHLESIVTDSYLSVMTVAELYQGIREGSERTLLEKTISAFTVLPITVEIAEQAGLYARQFRPSHGTGLADCIIAATADLHDLTLETLNSKHFPMLENVNVPYIKS